MKQRGVPNRYSADEIAMIRTAYALASHARLARRRVIDSLGLSRHDFNRIGSGAIGKKPRAA